MKFNIDGSCRTHIQGYTTRPDTIFGVDFMVLAPEHELVEYITTADQQDAVDEYLAICKKPQRA